MFNWIRGEIGINTLSDGSFGEAWMRGKIKKKKKKQVMKSFRNYAFNFFHCAAEMSKIPFGVEYHGRK